MSISGIGMDAIELSRVREVWERNGRFCERILTANELEIFHSLKGVRQLEFLAGRFAAKEAYSKAFGTGIGARLSFLDIEVLWDELGKPIVTKGPFRGQVHLSLSHTKETAFAYIIFEDE
ncbi:holo-[acyl-carrier protein] synthase [Granulicatella balaenopterae]|uniref:Holo-[acyl-carrier-protein] synthase n=1 Tax=Granulicatella balaenopterae TaxID=137733 RepID=A0A1H9JIE1_9LACT|nr:holo-ACP synthase [Granulicatella balaenopterae]SEQ86559.1 holo-[acyl-carrier protein] synthase [Granulicatella balaenopterae]